MQRIERVYLIGLGAIGGAYAGRIQENCPGCLRVVVDQERAERYGKSGIHINGSTVAFDYIAPGEAIDQADLIIIAVKQHHLKQTIEDMRGLAGRDTVILSLLNGISSEEVIGSVYGMEKMLHSLVVGTDSTRVGTDIIYGKIGNIVFGDKNGSESSEKVEAVKDFFDRVKIPYKVPEDIIREQWWKFMMNVGINQVSAVLRAPYGAFQKPGEARELMTAASQEVIEISKKIGISLSEADIVDYIKILEDLSPAGKTSMLQDVEACRKTEVEIFAGTVVELGKKYGIQTPLNDILFKMIKAIEKLA